MAKRNQYNMRWRENDAELLKRTIRNFNQRLYRQRKKNAEADYLPESYTMERAVSQIQTRSDFKSLIKSLNRFGAKTAKPIKSKRGAKMTEWERKENIRQQKIRKKREEKRAEELANMPVTQGGKPTGKTRAEMGKIKEQPSKIEISDPANKSQEEWELHKGFIEKALTPAFTYERAEMWQRNYIKGLIRQGIPQDVIELVQKVNPIDFARIIDTEEYATFDFIYDPAGVAAVAQYLREAWSDAASTEKAISDDVVKMKEEEVETEHATGYDGRRYTSDWWKWEKEHWGARRKPRRKRGK